MGLPPAPVAATAAAAGAVRLGLGLIDGQRPPVDLHAVDRLDSGLGGTAVGQLGETDDNVAEEGRQLSENLPKGAEQALKEQRE